MTDNSKWVCVEEYPVINLKFADVMLKELGHCETMFVKMWCDRCHKVTMVDASIFYRFCPHCGAEKEND